MPIPSKVLMRKITKRNKKNKLKKQQLQNESKEDVGEDSSQDVSTSFTSSPQKRKAEEALNNSVNSGSPDVSSPQKRKAEEALNDSVNSGSPKKKKKKKKKKLNTDSANHSQKAEAEGNQDAEEETENENTSGETSSINERNGNDLPHSTELGSKLPGSNAALGILSNASFKSLENIVNKNTLKAIEEMGFTSMTEIQAKAIPPLLEGRDLVGAAKTGSGKTLAFVIPAIELIVKIGFLPRNGTGCIIISPTRELSMQTFGVVKEMMKYHHHTYGLIMGGADRKMEAQKISKGINILVATPGRLLDHLQNTPDFLYKNLQCLVIDEADRILDVGFEEEIKKIVSILPKRRQTMLFSATNTPKTEALTKLALKKEPVYVGVDDNKEVATVEGLEQGYVICPSEKRFLLLFTFLKKNRDKKVMVFFSSCLSVKYHNELLNYIDLPVMCIHGKQKQQKRTTTFFQFCNADSGILLCTDVAARGLDIPAVDWIVQYDPPDDPKEYIHRVGRTARGDQGKGHALLILRPEELGFLCYLKKARIPLNEFEFSWNKIADIQLQLEKLISKNYFLNLAAKSAYKAYVRAYQSHHIKDIFDVQTLDLMKVAKSFGFTIPPAVDIGIEHNSASRPRKRLGGGGYGSFKTMNTKQALQAKMYKQKGGRKDGRQFAR